MGNKYNKIVNKNGKLYLNGELLIDVISDFTINENTIEGDKDMMNFPKVDKLKFYDRTTIIWWSDGTKTHVVAQENDSYDREKGIAMCFMKKALGNKGNFNDELTTLLGENLQEKRRAKRRERKENRRNNNA